MWIIYIYIKGNGKMKLGGGGNTSSEHYGGDPFCYKVGKEVDIYVDFPNFPNGGGWNDEKSF